MTDTTETTEKAFDPRALLAKSRLAVLATIKADGRPQLSPIMPSYDPEAGVVRIATGAGTAKVANLRRDPRVALEVTSEDGWEWATAEGTATITGPPTDPNGPEVDALVDYYRRAAGEHPDWDEYRTAVVEERHVLLTIKIDKVYGQKVN
ncbi:PPOX class probable F420-dependent enzyme [Saccharothrix carnea]|uniref:PPOX class probable F420-dependent enzyme n=1 Tax=Saccharothrix carnea TaxID=1280637 RepID=A0A2P8I0A0_SACCR|nr:PPOX class F420-dependent oxidoreductase [Saccharothrix carnea]PSL51881.1 PPOX class probable F420-dependent enzyme [Saccharothrix carnea]